MIILNDDSFNYSDRDCQGMFLIAQSNSDSVEDIAMCFEVPVEYVKLCLSLPAENEWDSITMLLEMGFSVDEILGGENG